MHLITSVSSRISPQNLQSDQLVKMWTSLSTRYNGLNGDPISSFEKRREKFVCIGDIIDTSDEEHCALNDAMPYGGMKYKPIPRRVRPRGRTATKHCAMFFFTLGFCCCCITPCAFHIL